MAVSSRGGHTIQHMIGARASSSVCWRCATGLSGSRGSFRRSSSVANTVTSRASGIADAAAVTAAISAPDPTPTRKAAPLAPIDYDVHAGLILTRAPLLTRQLHPFESAFFFYQKRLEERLNAPFITNVYFKPDTARRIDWQIKVGERGGATSHELGGYKGKNSTSWRDELLVGDKQSSPESMVESLLKDAQARVSDDAEVIPLDAVVPVEKPLPRETEADRTNDVRRLDRKLDRTLYLVVKSERGWQFPSDIVGRDENLHETVKRVMNQAAGVNMNTWIVSTVPVAHQVHQPTKDDAGIMQKRGVKFFFLKGRIMAGQANLTGNPFGYTDFKWLTKEELRSELDPVYYRSVRKMMVNR